MKDVHAEIERLKARVRALEGRLSELERALAPEPAAPEEPGRRRHPRRKALLRADYSDGRALRTEVATDISEGGACLRTSRPEAEGCHLDLVFEARALGRPLKVKGQVVRVAELPGAGRAPQFALGIRFLATDAHTQTLLRRLIASLPTQPGEPAFEEGDKDAWLAKMKDFGL